ncbi:MAG: CocE/NonD family hydrolase [Hyphomicrobiales bacterium]|nr:CocE/NonD family hydrolase [Hyphomicrobiales bacterium]
MRIDWDVPIPMDDGIVLRADLFRPDDGGKYPLILSYGAFGKGLAFQDGNKSAWDRLTAAFPEVTRGSSCKYQVWELVDPEKWVPDGYACLRVDARGAGRSPGFLDPWSARETDDIYAVIEWAAVQPWCDGKVGMNGISYFAMNQWTVAARRPPHLAAICVWEGAGDWYRDVARHGGIYCGFLDNLYPRAFHRVQYGLGERGFRSRVTGELVSGPPTLSAEELASNRRDIERFVLDHRFEDEATRARTADFSKIEVPLLSAANWGGQGLHPRGNFEGFLAAGSQQKWLEVHGDAHWSHFYSDYGIGLQKRFFGHFLKNEDTGWQKEPKVRLQIRHPGETFVERHEQEWPLARTQWTKLFLNPDGMSLDLTCPQATKALVYEPLGPGLDFSLPPLDRPLEITGPGAAKLRLSSASTDADVFLVLRVFDPEGQEVTFIGANDPRTPIANGWLRASHRKLDPTRGLPYRPYHSHDEAWPLPPNVPVDLDVEIWPTSIVVPPGYRLCLSVRGKDYAYEGPPLVLEGVKYTLTGVGPFLHVHPEDRPPEVFGATCKLHFAPEQPSYVLLPVIP